MRCPDLLRRAVVLTGAFYLGLYAIVALLRVGYPFELEWMEGAVVDHVARVLEGQPLYVAPSVDFVPFIYTPFYYYVSAAVAGVTGLGFVPLRLVSFAASLACFGLIFLLARRESSGSRLAGFIAGALFAATYRSSGAWFDVARVDSLFLALVLAGLFLLRARVTAAGFGAAGVCFALAFLTKQTGLAIALPMMVYALVADRRLGLLFIGTVAAVIGAATLALHSAHGGWYLYYTMELATGHGLDKSVALSFWTKDILAPLAIACCLGLLYLLHLWSRRRRRDLSFAAAATAGMVGAAFVSRLHEGGYDNVVMPAHAMIAVLFGAGFHHTMQLIETRWSEQRQRMTGYVYAVCLLQFAVLLYNPLSRLPSAADERAGWALVEQLAARPGEVWTSHHGYLGRMAGRKTHAHEMAVTDVLRGGDGRGVAGALAADIDRALRTGRFGAVLVDRPWFEQVMMTAYEPEGTPVFDDADAFWPVTGLLTRPERLYVPRRRDGLPSDR